MRPRGHVTHGRHGRARRRTSDELIGAVTYVALRVDLRWRNIVTSYDKFAYFLLLKIENSRNEATANYFLHPPYLQRSEIMRMVGARMSRRWLLSRMLRTHLMVW